MPNILAVLRAGEDVRIQSALLGSLPRVLASKAHDAASACNLRPTDPNRCTGAQPGLFGQRCLGCPSIAIGLWHCSVPCLWPRSLSLASGRLTMARFWRPPAVG